MNPTVEEIIRPLERMLRLKLQDLLTVYHSGNYVNILESPGKEHSFHGKIPVWVCWWQGFDSAPELVQLCRKNWYKNLPMELVEIHEINIENVTSYIDFPDWVNKLFSDEKIGYAHLSDMLRMSLLYHYGGLWLDATYYLSAPVPEDIFCSSESFFTLRSPQLFWEGDMAQGNWTCSFLKTPAHALLPQFVMNAFFYYFIEQDTPVHYFMMDLLVRIAYLDFPEVRDMINSCPFTNPTVLTLQDQLNEPWSETDWQHLTRETSVFKLSYKTSLQKYTDDGRPTFYGYLMEL